MNNLQKPINEYSPDGVIFKKMWEVTIWDKKFNGVSRHKQPRVDYYHYFLANDLKKLAVKNGDVKLLGTSDTDIGNTTVELAGTFLKDEEIVAIPWGGNPRVQYFKGKFLTSDNRIARSNNPSELSAKFLYYWMLNNLDLISSFYRGAGIAHPNMSQVLDMDVPVPPIIVQREIVRILDKMTYLEAELEAELEARILQYEHYRDDLLDFNSDVPRPPRLTHLLQTLCPDGVEFKSLNEVASINRGVRVVKSQLKENGEFPVFQNSLVPLGYHSSWNYPANSTFIIVAGAAGEIGFSKINFWAADDCFVIPDSINLNSRFVYYFLLTKQNYLFSRVRKASVPRLSRNFIENIKIPVPPLHIQEEIIAILDRFEALVSDLKDGLPAEIAARRKQYEYYRSQLLTFKPKPPHPL